MVTYFEQNHRGIGRRLSGVLWSPGNESQSDTCGSPFSGEVVADGATKDSWSVRYSLWFWFGLKAPDAGCHLPFWPKNVGLWLSGF